MLAISALNIILLILLLLRPSIEKHAGSTTGHPHSDRLVLRTSAAVFTVVCAYRAIAPRIDVPRTCWFDSPLNWIVFGRSAATVAEIAWATQMGLVQRCLAKALLARGLVSDSICCRCSQAGIAVIVIACIAECWSWTNLITENNVFAVVEQGLWMTLFLTTGIGIAVLLSHWPRRPLSFCLFVVLVCGMGFEQGYEAFGLYLPRFLSDQAHGKQYEGFPAGLWKLADCSEVTQSVDDWSGDIPWMTGYFSFGVWSSLWLMATPMPEVRLTVLLQPDP